MLTYFVFTSSLLNSKSTPRCPIKLQTIRDEGVCKETRQKLKQRSACLELFFSLSPILLTFFDIDTISNVLLEKLDNLFMA